MLSFINNLDFRPVKKRRKIYSTLSEESAFENALFVLRKMNINIINVEKDSGSISAFKNWSLGSAGEVISINIYA